MYSNEGKNNFNENLTFYEKIGKILCFTKKRYNKDLQKFIYLSLRERLNSTEILKLRCKLNFITYEKIINKEYLLYFDLETKRIIKKLKQDKSLMTRLRDYRDNYE